jgi:hypothetical protein
LRPGGNVGHKLLRCFARFFGSNHDRRAVGVVGPDKINRIALHSLKAHPDVGLDVLHDVTDVEIAIGVGQCGGNEELAWLAAGIIQKDTSASEVRFIAMINVGT